MSRLTFFSFLLMLCCLCPSCSDDEEKQIVFHVEVQNIDGNEVTVLVTHNGTNRDRYCGFAVEGTNMSVTDVRQAVADYVAAIDTTIYKDYSYLMHIKEQKKKIIRLVGLKPCTDYTYIVFGMDEHGRTYGTTGTVTFTTENNLWEVMENDAWQLNYQGYALYRFDYYSRIHVSVAEDCNESFFVCDYPTSVIETYGTDAALIAASVEEYKIQLETGTPSEAYNLGLFTESNDHYAFLQEQTEYISYAIGISPDGKPTGRYAKSRPYTTGRYPELAEYGQLTTYRNKWYLSDDGGTTEKEIKISEGQRNRSVRAYQKDFSALYRFTMDYSIYDHSLSLSAQKLSSYYSVKIDGKTRSGELDIMGWNVDAKGDTLLSRYGRLAEGQRLEDGSYTFTSATGLADSGIAYVLIPINDEPVILSGSVLAFPFSMYIK